MKRTAVLLAFALVAGACDGGDGGDDPAVDDTTEEGAEADEGAEDDGAEDEDDGAEDEGDAEEGASDVSVDLPDPCALLRSDDAALAEIVGAVSGFDGPEDSKETFNGRSYGERTCVANGERFDLQLELSPAAIIYAPQFFDDEEPVDGVGDGAYLLKDDKGKILTLAFKVGDVGGAVSLLFAGGNLAEAKEPTADDFEKAGRLVTSAV